LGVSIWTEVVLDKYLYGRPTGRLCQALRHHGVPLPQGTVTEGLRKLTPLIEPVMQALRARQMGEKLFHGDETRWDVFEEMPGKTGHRWYLWVTRSASVVFYHIAPSRGAAVPKAHFAELRKDLVEVVLVCDRYSAYKSLAKDHEELLLAFCWAHVRRDFLNAARSWPDLAPWMWKWLEDIRTLYRLNRARLAVWDATVPLEHQAAAFVERHGDLTAHLSAMQVRCEMYRRERHLHRAKRQILESLHNHWDGLTVFVARPEVALDNNAAERALRNPVVNRWVIKYSPQLEAEFHRRKRPVWVSWRMDETYIRVKGEWVYLYRAVDKFGKTIDFLLTDKRDQKAAKRFLTKAIGRNGLPETINIDKSGANAAAIVSYNAEHGTTITIRKNKYLNNIVEQDHRGVKRVTRPMLGFKSFEAAQSTLSGIELMRMIRKDQMEGDEVKGFSVAKQFYVLAL
jgi:transposase-like protein